MNAFRDSNELLLCLSDNIEHCKTLHSLCLVDRRFNDLFSAALYSCMIFHDGNNWLLTSRTEGGVPTIDYILKNPRLRYTRELYFTVQVPVSIESNSPTHGAVILLDREKSYGHAASAIVSRMEHLVKFECAGWSMPNSVVASTIFGSKLEDVSLRILYRSTDVPSLSSDEESDRSSNADPITEPVAWHLPFENLQRLELVEVWTERVGMEHLDQSTTNRIVSTLLAAPNLRSLGLSFRPGTGTDEEAENFDWARLYNFFQNMVREYKDRGGRPLRLRTLRLGYGMILNNPMDVSGQIEDEPALYLSDLIDRNVLEKLYLENEGDDWGASDPSGVSWLTISPTILPNLRRLCFRKLEDRVVNWLYTEADPGFISSLEIMILEGLLWYDEENRSSFENKMISVDKWVDLDEFWLTDTTLSSGVADLSLRETAPEIEMTTQQPGANFLSLSCFKEVELSDAAQQSPNHINCPKMIGFPLITCNDLSIFFNSGGLRTLMLTLEDPLSMWYGNPGRLQLIGAIPGLQSLWVMTWVLSSTPSSDMMYDKSPQWWLDQARKNHNALIEGGKPSWDLPEVWATEPWCLEFAHWIARGAYRHQTLRYIKVCQQAWQVNYSDHPTGAEQLVRLNPMDMREERKFGPDVFVSAYEK